MKRYVFSLVLIAVMLFVFTACNGNAPVSGNQANTPTDAEIEAAYQRAEEAYAWFEREVLPFDFDDYAIVQDEVNTLPTEYYRVIHDSISTLADLEAHLRTIFTEDIVRSLMNNNVMLYRDIDGALYTVGAERGGRMDAGDEVHEIIRESDNRIIYRITVDILDWDTLETVVDTEVHEFVYELIDGQWLFSNFNLTR